MQETLLFSRPAQLRQNLAGVGGSAWSTTGTGDIRYFSVVRPEGQVIVDSAYSLGGFWYDRSGKRIYVCVLDPRVGCALVSVDISVKIEQLLSQPFPRSFRVVGVNEANRLLLLESGLIDTGHFRGGEYISLSVESVRSTPMLLSNVGNLLLPRNIAVPPVEAYARRVISARTPSECRVGRSTYFARIALSEGESAVLSIWRTENGKLRRVSADVQSVVNWSWIVLRGKTHIVAATGVYDDAPSVRVWTEKTLQWRTVFSSSQFVSVRILGVSSVGRIDCECVTRAGTTVGRSVVID